MTTFAGETKGERGYAAAAQVGCGGEKRLVTAATSLCAAGRNGVGLLFELVG